MAAPATGPIALRARMSRCRLPTSSPSVDQARWCVVRELSRAIGLDVHRDFCEVGICEEGKVRAAGRVDSSPEALAALATSLGPDDRVALEVFGGAWAIRRAPRSARRQSGGGQPWRYRDRAGASEDRS